MFDEVFFFYKMLLIRKAASTIFICQKFYNFNPSPSILLSAYIAVFYFSQIVTKNPYRHRFTFYCAKYFESEVATCGCQVAWARAGLVRLHLPVAWEVHHFMACPLLNNTPVNGYMCLFHAGYFSFCFVVLSLILRCHAQSIIPY